MNTKTISAITAIIIIVAAVLIIRNVSGPQKAQNTTEPIRIGAVISLTGFAAPWGEYAKNGMNLAVKTINDAGGIDGRKIELVIEDDHTDGKDAVSAYTKLATLDHVDGILGGVFDFTAQPLIPLALTNKLPLISASNFRIAGGFDLNDQSFVMRTDFSKVISQLKTYVAGEHIKKLAVVHFQSTFGNEIAKTLDTVMKDAGQSGIINEEYAAIGDNNFRTTIAKLKADKVEAVFLDMVGNDPINFLTQSRQLGFTPKFISYNGITDSFAEQTDKSLLEGVVILNWEINSAGFTEMYQSAYGIPPTKSADTWFDAVYVLAQGIAKNEDRSAVAAYIAKTRFVTPNATISFTANHAVENTPVEIDVVKGGKLVPYQK